MHIFRDNLWNLPAVQLDDRWDLFNHIISLYLEERGAQGIRFNQQAKCRFLEIGVWEAGTAPRVFSRFGPIFDYIGVDPYGELRDDPYKGQFWATSEEADRVYALAQERFGEAGAILLRESSQAFFARKPEPFDVIFVDGDHRYTGALSDMKQSLALLKSGGLLIVDDYANCFHPEVEWAVRAFMNEHSNEIAHIGAHPLFFQLEGQIAPVLLTFMCFEKV